MSELTPCNYCTMKRIRRQAKENGLRVSTRTRPEAFAQYGLDVFVHPRDVKGEDRFQSKYFRAWMAELTDRCVC